MDFMPTETVTKRLFTVDEFMRMWEAGVFHPEARNELIRGEVMNRKRPGVRHAGDVSRLLHLLYRAFGYEVIVSVHNPVVLDSISMPVPDVALLRRTPDFYSSAHPRPADVLLLIEVSDTTVEWDSTIKADLYADADIVEYWVLDIPADALIVFTDPGNGVYQNVTTLHRGEIVSLLQIPDTRLDVVQILG